MAGDLRSALEKLLDDYDERRREVAAREQRVKDDDALFVARFAELRKSVIRPAFETAAAILAERGHKVSIAEEEFSVDAGGKVTEAGISIHIVPAGARAAASRDEVGPALSIRTRHYRKTVSISAGKPVEGAKGTYSLERIDRQLVEEELLKFVADLVAA